MSRRLSPRQIDLLEDAMRGLSIRESAESRYLSVGTIKATRAAIYLKLGARSMPHAIALYLGAIDREDAA